MSKQLKNQLNIKDYKDVNWNTVYLHYTNKNNLDSIMKNGLEPRIGENAKVIEKSKKIFFSMGDKGALVIMDTWIKWLIAKPKSNLIYWIGAYLLKIKYFPKIIHQIIIKFNNKNKNKTTWSFKKLKQILDNSIYLVLDLEEGIDFNFEDLDEVKAYSRYPVSYIESLYAYDSNGSDNKMEYWNMHTISNKVIEPNKISLLKYNEEYSASEIVKILIEDNMEFVKNKCKKLYEYYNYTYNFSTNINNITGIKELDWSNFYSFEAFFNSLSNDEKSFFNEPKFPSIIFYNYSKQSAHLHLSSNGIVEEAEYMSFAGIKDEDLKGKHIKEVVQLLKDNNISLSEDNDFIKAIRYYDTMKYQKEGMLDCAMYRILERGGNSIGPRRAYLFAKEFKRNIAIPLIYGVDRTDPDLRKIINQYIKDGSHKDLFFYTKNYTNNVKIESKQKITFQELIRDQGNDAAKFYDFVEHELHQRLVNALANNLSYEKYKKEKINEHQKRIQQLRIERKLAKSKR